MSSDHYQNTAPKTTVRLGVHTVVIDEKYFMYFGPKTRSKVWLTATTSGAGFMFHDGNVWLDGQQVIKKCKELPEGDKGEPQPTFSIWD
jgi:hypothetical protein